MIDNTPRIIRTVVNDTAAAYFVGSLACRYFQHLTKEHSHLFVWGGDTSSFRMPEPPCLDRNKNSSEGWSQEQNSSLETQSWAHNFGDWERQHIFLVFSGFTFMDRGLATGIARKVRPVGAYIQTGDAQSQDWLGLDVRRHAECDTREMHTISLNSKMADISDDDLIVISNELQRVTAFGQLFGKTIH